MKIHFLPYNYRYTKHRRYSITNQPLNFTMKIQKGNNEPENPKSSAI